MAQYGGYGNQSGYGQTNNRYDQPAGNSYDQPAANPYGQPAANPYGQQATNPYGQQSGNPYGATQSANPYSQSQQSNPYGAPSGKAYDEEQNTSGRNNNSNIIPMNHLNGGAGANSQQKRQDPRAILNECEDLRRGIDTIARNMEHLRRLQDQALNDPDSSQNTETKRQINSTFADITSTYDNFVRRIRVLKGKPMADSPTNADQITSVQSKLEGSRQKFVQQEHNYQVILREQATRQYRIIQPEATDAEVKKMLEDQSPEPLFSQALLKSDRRGQSQSAYRAVQSRHDDIQHITKTLEDLATMFGSIEKTIVEQDTVVTEIDKLAEQTQDHVSAGNTQLDGAITKVRAANRKKWYCLGIAILIILVIVIVVVVVVEVLKNK
ncbi:Plasma membrane t-SNARE, secretory vesicle fusion [Xylographa parallela]|nr:Plasma membrane t-SNARE, secretory vesicle fusion [Xylographa parallela]